MGSPAATGELELVPVATSVPSLAVLYRAEHVALIRRLALVGSPVDLAESIAHRAFARVARSWDATPDPVQAVRRFALDDVLSRFRPVGKAPTRTPPRTGAPAAWEAVAALLDPLAPPDRAAAVLRLYDGLEPAAIDRLVPSRRRVPLPPFDRATAERLVAAVADITPASRLTELLGSSLADLDVASPPSSTVRTPGRRWLGVALVALVGVGLLGGRVDVDVKVGSSAPRGQELLAGPPDASVGGAGGAPQSSCPSTEPVEGPGGTPLPQEGDTYPDRVARVLATDRRAILALHRNALDARLLPRSGRVERSQRGTGRVRNVDGGDDEQIQVVIKTVADCPRGPESWKGVPLVFTTRAAASQQPDDLVQGQFADHTAWTVRDRPGVGLCGGIRYDGCDQAVADPTSAERVPFVVDDAGHELVYGYLPASARTVRLETPFGVLGPPVQASDTGTFFALAVEPGEEPVRIRFFDRSGAGVGDLGFPGA